MSRSRSNLLLLGIVLWPVLLTQACAPFFTSDLFSHMELYFKLNEELAKGESSVVHAASFPGQVKVKKKWVRVSGSILPAGNGDLPSKVQVEAEVSDLNSGRVQQRIKMTVKIKNDGSFEASKKIPQDIAANSLMTVTAKADGGSIAKNSEVSICIDLFKKKADTKNVDSCATGGASFAAIEAEIFPTCATGQCHGSANPPDGLSLLPGQAFGNLVNVASVQKPNLQRVKPGDAAASYLVHKIRGDSSIAGGRMPLGLPALSQSDINKIIAWINSGAKNN